MMIVALPGARTWCHAFRGGRCAAAILTDRQQPKNKNTWIMISVPAGGVKTPQGNTWSGMG